MQENGLSGYYLGLRAIILHTLGVWVGLRFQHEALRPRTHLSIRVFRCPNGHASYMSSPAFARPAATRMPFMDQTLHDPKP